VIGTLLKTAENPEESAVILELLMRRFPFSGFCEPTQEEDGPCFPVPDEKYEGAVGTEIRDGAEGS
jgi:hypothetical protein